MTNTAFTAENNDPAFPYVDDERSCFVHDGAGTFVCEDCWQDRLSLLRHFLLTEKDAEWQALWAQEFRAMLRHAPAGFAIDNQTNSH